MRHYLHRQQHAATCAVAAVRTVLHYQFGQRLSEQALVALGTRAEKPILEHGSSTSEMRRMVRGASAAYNRGPQWKLRTSRKGSVVQLKRALAAGRLPIVQVYVKEVGEFHAVVVLAVDGDRIRVFDPDYTIKRNVRWMRADEFMEWWISPTDGERWWAVITGGMLRNDGRTHVG